MIISCNFVHTLQSNYWLNVLIALLLLLFILLLYVYKLDIDSAPMVCIVSCCVQNIQ